MVTGIEDVFDQEKTGVDKTSENDSEMEMTQFIREEMFAEKPLNKQNGSPGNSHVCFNEKYFMLEYSGI